MVDTRPLHTGQQSMSQPRPAAPQTPQRASTRERERQQVDQERERERQQVDRERERQQVDAESSISFTVNIPANLAADTDISVVLTPRSARIDRGRVPPQIIPLRFQRDAPGPPPATPSPSPTPPPTPVRPRAHRREPVMLDITDPVYPRPPGSVHPNDPVPSLPSRTRKFYCVFKGSKLGVFWDSWTYVTTISKDIGGYCRRLPTYEAAMTMWDTTDAAERELFTAD